VTSGNPQSASATDIETQAAAWLEHRNHAEWSEEDQAAFDAWLVQSLAHRVAYLRLEEAWRFADRLTALKSTPSLRKAGSALPWSRIVAGAVAACVVIAIVAIAVPLRSSKPAEQVYATGVGGTKRLALADGSQIELNTDTVIRIAKEGQTRKVWLDKGEAYFQVVHNANRPFVVVAGKHRLLDLGTKFLVREDKDRLHVSVLEGRVQYESTSHDASPSPTYLGAGDVLVATAKTRSVVRAGTTEISNALGWRMGVITLDNTTLADAAREFNRYSTRKLVVGPGAAQLRIMGTFQAGNADAFAAVVQDIFKLHVDHGKTEIVITR
jgi:transmembrane sensor